MNTIVEIIKGSVLCGKLTRWSMTKSLNEFIDALDGLKDDFSRSVAVEFTHNMIWSNIPIDVKLRTITYGLPGWYYIHKYASKIYAENY